MSGSAVPRTHEPIINNEQCDVSDFERQTLDPQLYYCRPFCGCTRVFVEPAARSKQQAHTAEVSF